MGKLDVRIRHGGGGPDLAALLPVAAAVVAGALIYEALSAFARMLGDIAAVAVVAAVSAAIAVGATLLAVQVRARRDAHVHAERVAAAFAREHQARALERAPAPLALPAPQQGPVIHNHFHFGADLTAMLSGQQQPPPVVVIPPSASEEGPR